VVLLLKDISIITDTFKFYKRGINKKVLIFTRKPLDINENV